MADYHILSGDKFGNRFTVGFHIPVPDVNNDVGINYRSALVEWKGGASEIASQVPFIQGAELTQLQAGEVYEVLRPFYSNPNDNLAQKQVKLDTMFNEIKTEIQSDIQDTLAFWGYSRTIP